jgi:hypothetical protein
MVDGKEKPADKSKWAKELKERAEGKVEAAVKAKPKEQHLPGMEPKKNESVENAIETYVEARDARMAAGEVELEARAKLVSALKKSGLSKYKRGPFSAELATQDKVKARVKDEETKEKS